MENRLAVAGYMSFKTRLLPMLNANCGESEASFQSCVLIEENLVLEVSAAVGGYRHHHVPSFLDQGNFGKL